MILFLAICAGLVWLGLVVVMFGWAMTGAVEEKGWRVAARRFGVLIVFIAGSIAVAEAVFDGNDPHASQLCLSGHERWVVQHSRSGDYETKQWVCTQWE